MVQLGTNQNFVSLPQQSNQRVVFLQPVNTPNGQIAYIQSPQATPTPKTEPNQTQVGLRLL